MARIFHAIAYDIIGLVEGSKPALADHATDDTAFTALIKQILKDLIKTLSDVSQAIIRWFAHFLVEPKTEWDFDTKHAFYTHMEQQEPDMRALKREFPHLNISFKTIHASKGLQADHVVLLNADSGRMGFPSEIVDDPLLTLVSPEEEMFENAEERG